MHCQINYPILENLIQLLNDKKYSKISTVDQIVMDESIDNVIFVSPCT
jgi:hypothetical protein